MYASDPHTTIIPSFRRRAARYRAELARMVTVLQITEPWSSPRILKLLRDAELIEHGLFTLAHPGGLTDDEQRFVVERLLPIVPESISGAVGTPIPTSVPVGLSITGKLTPGQGQPPLVLNLVTGSATPKGAVLTLLRGNATIFSYSDAAGGSYQQSYSDTAPGTVYTAQLTYQGKLLGQATARPETAATVYYGVQPRGQELTADFIKSLHTRTVQPLVEVTFTLEFGRGNLIVVIPPGMSVLIQDPRTQAFFTDTFIDAYVDGIDGSVIRQALSSIGPFSLPAHLLFS